MAKAPIEKTGRRPEKKIDQLTLTMERMEGLNAIQETDG